MPAAASASRPISRSRSGRTCAFRCPLAKRRAMSGMQLDKTFDPAAIEAKWYAHWEENGLFRPERPDAIEDAPLQTAHAGTAGDAGRARHIR